MGKSPKPCALKALYSNPCNCELYYQYYKFKKFDFGTGEENDDSCSERCCGSYRETR